MHTGASVDEQQQQQRHRFVPKEEGAVVSSQPFVFVSSPSLIDFAVQLRLNSNFRPITRLWKVQGGQNRIPTGSNYHFTQVKIFHQLIFSNANPNLKAILTKNLTKVDFRRKNSGMPVQPALTRASSTAAATAAALLATTMWAWAASPSSSSVY